MVKEVFFFTEMGYSAYSQETAARYGYTNLMFPNENFSPEKASELYSMYFEELQYCTESGFDGVMNPEGGRLGLIRTPEPCHNFTIGGEDLQAIFFACRTTIYRMGISATGIAVCG